MTIHKISKLRITETVLAEIPLIERHNYPKTPDEAVSDWWYTSRSEGLRLTTKGAEAFTKANIEYFDFDLDSKKIDNQSWFSFLLDCTKRIKCPYFLGIERIEHQKKRPYIRIFDSKIAMMISLYGNIFEYLTSLNRTEGYRNDREQKTTNT